MREPYLHGRTVVVTGGARGIGRALAHEAATRGAGLVSVLDIDGDLARSTAQDLNDQGFRAEAHCCDLADGLELRAVADRIVSRHGVPGLVCANAGVAGPFSPGLLDDPATVEWVLAVNVMGVITTLQAFGRPMLESEEEGRLLVTASEHAVSAPHIGMSSYTASKHAVFGFADVIRTELPEHMRITVVCPSMVATDLWRAGRARAQRFGGPLPADEVAGAVMRRATPPEHVASLALDGVAAGRFMVLTDPVSAGPVRRRAGELTEATDVQCLAGEETR